MIQILLYLFAACWLVQAAYAIFLFIPWAIRAVQSTRATNRPVSIVVCARNEATNLPQLLPALLEQQYPEFEVVLVDDASTDATLSIMKQWQSRFPERLRVQHLTKKTHPGKKQALRLGLDAARYPTLVLTDADCRPASRHWLQHLMGAYGPENDLVLGYGPVAPEKGRWNAWLRYETFITAVQYFALAQAGQPYMGVGRNLSWTRSLFRQAGGFSAHEHLASGDDDLLVSAAATARNTALCAHPDSWVYTTGKPDLSSWWRQKRRHLSTSVLYRPRQQFLLGLFAGAHVIGHFVALLLLIAGAWWYLLAAFLSWLLLLTLLVPALRRLGCADLIPRLPLLDIGLSIYWGIGVPLAFLVPPRKTGWE